MRETHTREIICIFIYVQFSLIVFTPLHDFKLKTTKRCAAAAADDDDVDDVVVEHDALQ